MQATWTAILHHWVRGIRFYIAIMIGLLSLESWWWAWTNFAGSNLLAIRLEETYAWFAVGFLSLALAIGPVCRLFKTLPGKALAYDARRMLGIGAAWFATLHITIAYLSLFKLANPFNIPGEYERSFLIGALAWLVLLAMAFTSFTAAMRQMGQWWFRLHRLVYAAAVLILLHAFSIGAHAARPTALIPLCLVATGLLGLHSLALIRHTRRPTYWQLATVCLMIIGLAVVLNYGYDQRDHYKVQAQTSSTPGGSDAAAY